MYHELRKRGTSAADLKFLQQLPQTRVRNFKSKSGTRIIELLVPLCFRSSCQNVLRCITSFGNGALAHRAMTLERPPSFKFDPAHLLGGFGGVYLANAIVAFLFSPSPPLAIILAASQRGGLSEADIASWLFGCFFISGVISLAFCLTYRQPLVFYWTIPGSVLVGQALDHLSFAQVIGAY